MADVADNRTAKNLIMMPLNIAETKPHVKYEKKNCPPVPNGSEYISDSVDAAVQSVCGCAQAMTMEWQTKHQHFADRLISQKDRITHKP